MKNIFTLFVIVLSAAIFGVSCTTTDGSASNENSTKLKHDFTEGLIAYYPFNGNPMDGTGNGNHGEIKGAALVKDRHGQAAKAYEFDGRSYIQFETSEELQTSKSTISYWLNATGTSEFESLPGFPGYQSHISKGKLVYGIAGKTVRDPLCNLAEGGMTVEMICAVFESHRQNGAAVPIPLKERENALAKLK